MFTKGFPIPNAFWPRTYNFLSSGSMDTTSTRCRRREMLAGAVLPALVCLGCDVPLIWQCTLWSKEV